MNCAPVRPGFNKRQIQRQTAVKDGFYRSRHAVVIERKTPQNPIGVQHFIQDTGHLIRDHAPARRCRPAAETAAAGINAQFAEIQGLHAQLGFQLVFHARNERLRQLIRIA